MKICRFNRNRIGVVSDAGVHDVTDLFNLTATWPLPPGDLVIHQLSELLPAIAEAWPTRPPIPLDSIRLESPVANPGKVIGAPINYKAHIDEANADFEINKGKTYVSIDQYGLFQKATSSVIGVADSVERRHEDRRLDHEIELVLVIGKRAHRVDRAHALEYVVGYCAGLDMTIRGAEVPSFRKSLDTFTVLGPWIVTKDDVVDPNNLDLWLNVNGEPRQRSNTSKLIFNVERLVEYASAYFTLHPGDVIMTGTPEGVGPVLAGDVMTAEVESLGTMSVRIVRSADLPVA